MDFRKKPRQPVLIGCIVAFLCAVVLFSRLQAPPGAEGVPAPMTYGEMMSHARDKTVASVLLGPGAALVKSTDGKEYLAVVPEDAHPSDQLVALGVDVGAMPRKVPGALAAILSWVPLLLMAYFLVWSMRAAGGRKGGPFSVGRSRVRKADPVAALKVGFADVAGVEQAKSDLGEIVDFLKDPGRFRRLGAKPPRGCLLVGPPGTGKTLLARAVAGEAGVPFFSASGSDFVEMFVGVGASRVRDTFEQARKAAPCILFIDEIDAMGRHRGGAGYGNDEREQTLNALLVEMDGFTPGEGVVVLAATNRPDVLDPALLRPGRFDRQVMVDNPDIAGREAILLVHMKNMPLEGGMVLGASVRTVARGTPGFSGADLANLVNEAALSAGRRSGSGISLADLESARDRVMMGAERRTLAITPEERRLTAYHEAGHALCAVLEPGSDPVHKATIVPRGQALGLVMRLPETDRTSMSLERLEADLTVAMAGRAAEHAVFGPRKITTGARADIKMATRTAVSMVTQWGLSERLGTVLYPSEDDEQGPSAAAWGRGGRTVSDVTALAIDEEIRRIVDEASSRAEGHIQTHIAQLHALAGALLDRETLDGDEIRALVLGSGGGMPIQSAAC